MENEALSKLQSLLQSSDSAGIENLAKAGDGNGDGNGDDDDEYDPEYMKKYMKRFMKDQGQEGMKEYMKNLKDMSKALDDAAGAAARANGGEPPEAYVVDGSTMVKAFHDFASETMKTLQSMSERIGNVEKVSAQTAQLSAHTAPVLAKAAEQIDAIGAQPNTPQGQAFDPNAQVAGQQAQTQPQDPQAAMAQSMTKALQDHGGVAGLRQKILAKAQSGDGTARDLIPRLEVAGFNPQRLNPTDQAKIQQLVSA